MATCPKDRLLAIVNDIELISKELFEYLLSPRHVRQNLIDCNQLADLLVKKEYELKEALESAQEQELIQSKIDKLRSDVQEHDHELQKLQQSLKEAEHILATAIYQAKQKLSLIEKANSHPISTEELIKYAHKISADHSVAAPYTWDIGDPRRPYPTDLEMKTGLLANSNEANLTHLLQQNQQQASYMANTPMAAENSMARPPPTASASNSPYPWPNQYDIKPNMNSVNTTYDHHLEAKANKDNDDVEVMSTDSSSSSSSDSP